MSSPTKRPRTEGGDARPAGRGEGGARAGVDPTATRRIEDFEPLPFRRHAWPSYDTFPSDLRSRTTGLSPDALALFLILPAVAWEIGEGWFVRIPASRWIQFAPIDLGDARPALEELAARDLVVWDEHDGSIRVGFPFLHRQLENKKRGRSQKSATDRAVDSPVDRPPPSPPPSPALSSAPAPAEEETEAAGAASRRAAARPVAHSDDVDRVFAHYRSLHPRARPGEKERRLVAARLRDGFSVEDLVQAINGCHASPFHRGENEHRRPYQSAELIFRDAKHVQDFIECVTRIEHPTPGIDADAVAAMTRRFGLDATRDALSGEQNGSLTDGTP